MNSPIPSPEVIHRKYRRTQVVNRLILSLMILTLGGLITAGIDYLLGVSFKESSLVTQVIHKVTYMAWGVAFWKLL